MSQPTEIPMATMAAPAAYPTLENMTTNQVAEVSEQTTGQCENHHNEESGSSSLLRLRGGAGCITDCLAAIGCCFLCEDCCC